MGGLVSGLFGLFGGDPTKKEENQLGALGGYDTGMGEGLTTAGAGYDEALISGDPTRMAQALAPEITTGQNMLQQQTSENAQFAPRSGGTAASSAAAQAGERGNIIDLMGNLQKGAAGEALTAGPGLLGQATSNINDEAQLARAQNTAKQADIGAIAQGAAQIAAAPFTGGSSLGMGSMSAPGGGAPNQVAPNLIEQSVPEDQISSDIYTPDYSQELLQ